MSRNDYAVPRLSLPRRTRNTESVPAAPILICYDDSDEARHAIATAAAPCGRRRAVVLDVGPVLTAAESVFDTLPAAPSFAIEEVNIDDARRRADAGAEPARHAGFDAEPRSGIAAPIWEGIVDVANEIDAAVIVRGTPALTGPRDVERSVSHQVAQHAKRPVLIVPPA
jgi:nucleotide-binding universal stress UspA family protein